LNNIKNSYGTGATRLQKRAFSLSWCITGAETGRGSCQRNVAQKSTEKNSPSKGKSIQEGEKTMHEN